MHPLTTGDASVYSTLPDDLILLVMAHYKAHLHKRMLNYQFHACMAHLNRIKASYGLSAFPRPSYVEFFLFYILTGII